MPIFRCQRHQFWCQCPLPSYAKKNLVFYTKHQGFYVFKLSFLPSNCLHFLLLIGPAYHYKVTRTGNQKYHVSFHFNFRQTMHQKRQYPCANSDMDSPDAVASLQAEVAGTVQGSTRYDCWLWMETIMTRALFENCYSCLLAHERVKLTREKNC